MKIGIITHYYRSSNYGGNLQAYALCKELEKLGFEAEQICADFTGGLPMGEPVGPGKCLLHRAKLALDPYGRWNHLRHPLVAQKCRQRERAVRAFGETIPHSSRVYGDSNLSDTNRIYQAFITGSDQVWNPECYSPAYYLDFAGKGALKLSYAASISKSQLSPAQRETMKEHLADFTAISLREAEAVDLVKDLAPGKVSWVLDPTLLLSRQEWDEVCAPPVIREPYVFCFFLGGDESHRAAAQAFARKKKLKLVTMPYLLGKYRPCDKNFGDIRLFAVSPPQWISLIKHGAYVFTDSFHGSVFSQIYEKNYFAFCRDGAKGMETRLESLTKLFGNPNRFCNTKEKMTLDYLLKTSEGGLNDEKSLFREKKEESVEFLWNNLQNARDSMK